MSGKGPSRLTLKPCRHCGGMGKVVNPSWLRYTRLRANETLRGAARRLGYSAAYLCDLEYGRRHCSLALADEYATLGGASDRRR